jgi:hypothetical protein
MLASTPENLQTSWVLKPAEPRVRFFDECALLFGSVNVMLSLLKVVIGAKHAEVSAIMSHICAFPDRH